MVVGEPSIHNIMSGMESTGGVRLHNHKRKLKQRFDIIKKLGQGTYGKVQLGINKETGQEVAIKTIKKCKIETEADLIRIRREIQIMSSVQHPNIIHIYEVFENREKMVLVMEYAAGGELYDYLSERKVLSEEEARRIFRQISIAVFYCHKHKICHRDLKLENILLDHLGNAKIADFGLSNVFDEQRLLNTFCGSPLYASPEIVKGTPYHGPEVDCWSLGVLLYTLVYGAMPFDGSNFKRLTRQISASDYFEPKNPSPASPLIRDMLTKCPARRADIERICCHWWVNEGYEQNCLDIAEDLAAQTPVRLDLLLSLVPQSASADKLVVTNDQSPETGRNIGTETIPPTRCLSVGSLMDLDRNNSDRIREMVAEEEPPRTNATNDTKRKLESTPSMEENVEAGVKKKDRSRRKERTDDREPRSYRSTSRHHSAPITNAITEEAMEVEPSVELDLRDPAAAAACLELIREAQSKSPSKERSRTPVPLEEKVRPSEQQVFKENFNDTTQDVKPIANKLDSVADKVNSGEKQSIDQVINKTQVKNKSVKSKTNDVAQNINDNASKQDVPSKNIESPQKINSVQHINSEGSEKISTPTEEKAEVKNENKKLKQKAQSLDEEAVAPSKPTERRRSKIFETAEKFNQLLSGSEPEKPKKIFIPGVNVGGAKRAFERKASLSSVTVPQPVKSSASKVIINLPNDKNEKKNDKAEEKLTTVTKSESSSIKNEEERRRDEEKKRAVDIITGALGKPPVQKKINGSPPMTPQSQESKNLGLKIQLGPNDLRNATVSVSTPVDTKYPDFESSPVKPAAVANSVPTTPESKSINNSFTDEPTMSSKMEIKLKSATLPRPRKTSKAEITLAGVKAPEPAFKSEVEAKIDAFHPQKLRTQKSEVAFPVAAVTSQANRSSSLEPESNKSKILGKERIIPIHVEPGHQIQNSATPPSKPPMPQRSISQRSNSLSRQSTADSDTDSALGSTVGPEPIRKSPREYIIPIAVEGGGYVTPRSGSVEPESKTSTPTSTNPPRARFGIGRRMGSLLSDASEDESPFSTLHRDSDDLLQRHMHRLRSSRPSRQAPEHADSLSSGEDDDDDGFELLTAENLFSTLLSRVRSLTQRLNVDDNRGTGFPRSRLLDRLGSNSSQGFWGMSEPLSRRLAESPFRRSLSRNTDRFGRKDSAMSSNPGTPTSLGARTTPSHESIFELGSSNTLPRDKSYEVEAPESRKKDQESDSRPNSSTSGTRDSFTPSLARRLSRQFIEQTRQSLPRSPSIPRDRLYRSSTEEPDSLSSLLPDRSMYRSKSSDRSLRRTNSLLENDREERPELRCRRSVSLFEDDDDETLPPLPRQVMTLGRKYRDTIKSAVNGIRRDNICLAEKIQEEPTDELTSPKKNPLQVLEQASPSEGTSVCNSATNLGDTTSSLSTKSLETSPGDSSSNIQQQGEALNSFRADAKEFESRLLAAENLIKESKLRNLGLNKFDPNLSSSYKDTEKCDKQLLGSMTDLTSGVLNKRRSCIPSLRLRSGSLTREAMDRRSTLTSPEPINIRAATPERSLLSKLFRSGSISRDRDSESKDKSPKTKRRISRFLRPDFFDTPREESQYVKDKEAQKAAENERRKSRFMKRKENKDVKEEKEEKPEKELKNQANEITRDQSEALTNFNKNFNNKPEINSNSVNVDNLSTDKLERQNSKNSFFQTLEKKLEKLRSNDESQKLESSEPLKVQSTDDDSQKINGDLSVKEEINNSVVETLSEAEVIKKVASMEDLTVSEPAPPTKSKVSSVLGLFRNDSKSAVNGGRQQTLLSKLKKNVYRGSRSDSVLTSEASSKIPKAKAEVKTGEIKPRRSLELKRSPEKVGDKKSPPKDKIKEKSPTERASVERKSLEKQIKSPEKSIQIVKVEKTNVPEKEIRKSKSPEIKVDKTLSSSKLAKKISPDKVVDNKKAEAKNIEADEKKLKKKSVKSLSSAKNGSVSKLEKVDKDEADKKSDKVKKVVKKEVIEKDADGTKKKKIVRVVKKVVKKSESSSDKPDEKEKDKEKKTLLKKITSSVKKDNSPETDKGKKIEKSIESIDSEVLINCEPPLNCLENLSNNISGVVLSVKDHSEQDNYFKIASNDLNTNNLDGKIPVNNIDNKIISKNFDTKTFNKDLEENTKVIDKISDKKVPSKDLDTKIFSNDQDTKTTSQNCNINTPSEVLNINILSNGLDVIISTNPEEEMPNNDLVKKILTNDQEEMEVIKDLDGKTRANRSNLKLDLSKIPQHSFKNGAANKEYIKDPEFSEKPENSSKIQSILTKEKIVTEKPPKGAALKPETERTKQENSITATYQTEDILSPMDDVESFDSWSICSNDINHRSSLDLCSPTSPVYSPSVRSEHSESIIDRIRRKSFYSRFNERKRKSSLSVPSSSLSPSSTLPRKFSFHSNRDSKNLSYTSPSRRNPERTHSLYNEDLPSMRKSPVERDRYSDGSYLSDLKSPVDHYNTSSSSSSSLYYDPLRRYRISPGDSTNRKYQSTDFGLDNDLNIYKNPQSPSSSSSSTLNDVSDYRSNTLRKYGKNQHKTADYYEDLLAPSRIDYLSARKTSPLLTEPLGRNENGHYNGHFHQTSDSDKWRYSDKISSPDSPENSDKSCGDDLKSNSQTIEESKELSAACPDPETTT
ncbi:nuak family kinase 1 isoform X2 [Cotesia typhae]|uniref:nuak family kinase 1 isoform X2 n=1 Tax=Cotesia typhae TaxID=2053667 RepID=UPI003D680FD6